MTTGFGYTSIPETNFVGFDPKLDEGEWKAVDTKKLLDAEGKLAHGVDALRALPLYKLRLRAAIGALVKALGAVNDGSVADSNWDRYQLRLDAEVTARETDDDPAVAAAATRCRAALLKGRGTQQTNYKWKQEVAFARTQLRLAAEKPLADDVALCGLNPTLARIKDATNALDEAVKHDESGTRPQPRALQVRAAMNGCVGAFNSVHDDLVWLLDHSTPGNNRGQIEALIAPLQHLLDDNTGVAAAPPVKAVAPPAAAAATAPKTNG